MNHYSLTPQTAKTVKTLIITAASIFLMTGLFQSLIPFLGLSFLALDQKFIWQLFTYLFVHPPFSNLELYTLFPFALQMYLLWNFGGELIERKGKKAFFFLYFGSAFISGLSSLLIMTLSNNLTILTGLTSATYALLIGWVMLNPFARLSLFFTFPIKAHHLILGLLGLCLLLDISKGNWVSATNYLSSAIYGYLFSLLCWKAHSPVDQLYSFETKLIRFSDKISHIFSAEKTSRFYDYKTGRPISKKRIFFSKFFKKK